MTTETIRLEVESMGSLPKVIEFQGRVIEHSVPQTSVLSSVDGFTSAGNVGGEHLIVEGLPQDFDFGPDWNVIACASLGNRSRYLSQPISRERTGVALINLSPF